MCRRHELGRIGEIHPQLSREPSTARSASATRTGPVSTPPRSRPAPTAARSSSSSSAGTCAAPGRSYLSGPSRVATTLPSRNEQADNNLRRSGRFRCLRRADECQRRVDGSDIPWVAGDDRMPPIARADGHAHIYYVCRPGGRASGTRPKRRFWRRVGRPTCSTPVARGRSGPDVRRRATPGPVPGPGWPLPHGRIIAPALAR
jgi:hypothetical protein